MSACVTVQEVLYRFARWITHNASMRQARRNIFIGVLILLFAAFTWVVLKSREPSYHGKTLTEWLEEISNSDVHEYTDADPEAINAIRQIGTRGLPTLLRLLASKDSRLKEWILENRNQPWMINFHLRSADELHNMAVAGFEILGSKAQPAVPELITLLHDQDRIIRIEASFCLGYVGPAAQAAVPDLIKELEREERDNNLAPEVYALRSIGSPADSNCIPALTAALTCALTNYSYDNKIMAQAALINLKPASISTFIEQLKNTSDERAWRKAAMVTAFCGTNAMPAVPLLITGLSQTN